MYNRRQQARSSDLSRFARPTSAPLPPAGRPRTDPANLPKRLRPQSAAMKGLSHFAKPSR